MKVLVVGAGPAGAAAALELARSSATVLLAEKNAWPRVKTCGDGISPHAIAEAAALGLRIDGPVHLERCTITTPGKRAFEGSWPVETPWGATVERRAFDASLVDAAIAAGAEFSPGTVVTVLERNRRGIRAALRTAGVEREFLADVVLLAEGATGSLALRAGFPRFRSRLVAIRGYADALHVLAPKYGLFYDRLVTPGYGWIFPMNERTANVGICVDERLLARHGGNARKLLTRWLSESERARDLLGERPELRAVTGGIIPTGRRFRTKRRIFLIGDAAGVADPFTAEGIYQAIRSGRLAATALLKTRSVRAAARAYECSLRVFDRNERAARGLRATFGVAIGPYARHAAKHPAFASHLNTEVFLPKRSLLSFVWRLARVWNAPEPGG